MVYSYVSKDGKKNLEPTTKRGFIVGCIETTHAYKVYIPSLKRNVLRRDVRFEEEKAMRSSLE